MYLLSHFLAFHLTICMCLQRSGIGTAQLSKSFFNFTDTQDVRVAVGYNAFINHRGDIIKVCSQGSSLANEQLLNINEHENNLNALTRFAVNV